MDFPIFFGKDFFVFSAFRNRDYLLYWLGAAVSFTGSWVQSVCHGWLVYDITDSELWLGLVGFFGALPTSGLTLFGGAIADRVNKRHALIFTQSMFAVFAAILGVLVQTGTVTKYHIIVIAFLQGFITAVDAPMRHSMPAVLVKKDNLMNAIALNSAAFNSARIIGPAVAGLLVANFSMALCFYLNAASYLAVIIALLLIKTRTPAKPKSGASVFIDIADGLRYIKQEKRILNLMLVLAVSSLFVMPYVTLIPVFAKDILKMGIEANAKLLTSIGIGAVVGSLLLAGLSHLPGRARILIISSAIGGVMLIAFANSEHLLLSQIILIGLGFSVVSFNQTTNTLIQGVTDDAYRGRVMSVYVFTFMGLSPLANLQAGVLAHTLGAPLTVTLWGFIFLSLSVFILLKLPVFNYEKCNH